MTTLIWQTGLMLLCAYFLGAWLACIFRRTFFARAADRGAGDLATAGAIAGAQAGDGRIVAPPVRRPDPKPIAIETIERAAPIAAVDAASRFEQALTEAPKSARPAAAPPAAATPSAPPAAAAAPPAKPAASPTPAASAAGLSGAAAAAAAGAIAQAAAAAMARAPAPSAPSAPSAPLNLPAAASGAGPASVSAPLAATPAAPTVDDLTRIRAIDLALRAKLEKLGVARYRDIAGWLPADVARISKELGFSGRIEQENWIEQAQILARGGDTDYARRKDRGLIANAAPTPNEGQAKPIVTPAATPAAAPAKAAIAPQVATPAAKPAVAPAAAVTTPQVTTPAATPAAAPAAVASAPQVATRAAFAQAEPVAPAAGLAAAAAAAAAAGMATASGLQRDNLQRISGINAEVEKLLNVQGVSRYAQLAAWTPSDATRIDRLLGHEGRIARENWIEQAAMLARGGDTAFSRQFDQQRAQAAKAGSLAADTARPSRLADAIRETAGKSGSAGAEPAAPAAARGTELSGLRSVRSEAYAPAGKQDRQDDLKRIRGVGVLIEKKLNSMGVYTYAQVANWSAADIDRVSQVLDFKGRIERENWVEQARILTAGGQTEFSRRVDRGDVETGRNR